MSDELQTRICALASYADLFFRLRDAALLLDAQNLTILDYNDAAEALLGLPGASLLGQPLLSFLPEAKKDDFEHTLRITRRRYHPREWESELINQENKTSIPVHINGCVLKLSDSSKSDESEAIQLILRDIQKEKESEAAIQKYIGELELLNKKLEALSTTDEMTHLWNFRHFKTLLEAEHSRAARYRGVYSIIFFDLDHFKHYNDRNGHPAGDELLRQLASIVMKSCRDTDFPARYGGEEFAILCPEVEWSQALVLAQRIHTNIQETSFPLGEFQPLGRISVSIGVASYPHNGLSAEEVLQSADKALYEAKKTGRNRIVCFSNIAK